MVTRNRVDRHKTLLMICDVQERFREGTHGFNYMSQSIVKLIKASKYMKMATLLTEQNGSGMFGLQVLTISPLLKQPRPYLCRIGPTAHEIRSELTGPQHLGTFGKDCFTMITDEVLPFLKNYDNFILVGIEAHVCILQTVLDLLDDPRLQKRVYILADAISACHELEIPLALDRMRDMGAVVTTSEAILFQLMGDGAATDDKPISELIKAERKNTAKALETLLPHPSHTAPIK
ncbi:hypothetical protein I317_07384 [Kwoniella heveanensis CBS 569]|uniref:Isochorismatase-like domain-containing protein n=1 Tax=Kwoniella heveanensis BCC8398 TaxID=1296120 RepID=A0A1B9H1D7_9TREE|nr:hypothetical protein I316_00969 [Kwoniella heveanensis BCC8398]OCF38842.1 hypothetical protein I317_07384 [Kwoniella heveanensis CBS 569]